jgi:hypothetical protein
MSAYAQSEETSSTAAWIVLGIDGKPYHDSLSSQSRSESGRKVLEWRILRAKIIAALATGIATSNLRSVDVWSKNNSLAAVQIEDVDKARFQKGTGHLSSEEFNRQTDFLHGAATFKGSSVIGFDRSCLRGVQVYPSYRMRSKFEIERGTRVVELE